MNINCSPNSIFPKLGLTRICVALWFLIFIKSFKAFKAYFFVLGKEKNKIKSILLAEKKYSFF